MGSANGTFVNGKRLSRPAVESEPQAVRSGDIIVGISPIADALNLIKWDNRRWALI